MKDIFKKISVLILSMSLVSCVNSQEEISTVSTIESTNNTIESVSTALSSVTTTITTLDTTTENIITDTSETTFKYTDILKDCPKDTLPEDVQCIEWSEDMVFYDLPSIENYVDICMSNCQKDIGFIVPNDCPLPNTDDYKNFDKGIWSFKGSNNILKYGDGKKANFVVYHFEYTTGAMVSKAYREKDTSILNSEQLEVYNVAFKYITSKLDKTQSIVGQEKQIYDYICENVTYYNDESEVKQYDRFRSSIGALLDGSANCMGYADTFYLLCSMAGMEVIYVSEDNENHAWNIITLDDKKYLVDVTFADTIYGFDNLISYQFFNASLDYSSQKYNLSENNPTKDIVSNFDENYYFYHDDFSPIRANSSNIYDMVALQIQNGETCFEIMCEDNLPTNDEHEFIQNVFSKLSSEFNGLNMGCVLQSFNGFGYVYIDLEY